MPETQEQHDAAKTVSKEEITRRIASEWIAMADILDKVDVPKTMKPSDIKLPEDLELDEKEEIKKTLGEDILYLTEPERLSWLAGKCAFYVKEANKRKISDFEPLSRYMDKMKEGNKKVYFILQADGTCYVTPERSGAPMEIWASVDEMAIDLTLQEQGQ